MAVFRPQHNVDSLIVGLGNPGPAYEGTRHNVGYQVVEELARRHGFAKAKRGFDGRCAEGAIGGRPALLLQPTTFMNDSGRSVAAAVRALKVPLERVLVVHDHIGGLLGPGYVRLRVGVDRPPSSDPDVVADYVLSRFGESKAEVTGLLGASADAVELWLHDGLEEAANRINSRER